MKKVVIYESLSHPIPTGIGWAEGFGALGWECFILPLNYNINEIDDNNIDILVIMSINPKLVNDIIKYKENNPSTKIIIHCFKFQDYYLKLKDYIEVWTESTMVHDLTKSYFQQHGMKFLHTPLAASNKLFFQTKSPIKYDVSFVGQFGNTGHGYRDEDKYLYPIKNNKKYKGFYAGFDGLLGVPHNSLNELYNSTKVNLNFHYNYQKQESSTDQLYRKDFNGRVYEIAMSGNFQLCDHPSVIDIFEGNINYSTKEEWINNLDYYLTHESICKEMSREAQRICINNHTWECRMRNLIDNIY